jgi:integrase
MAMCMVGLGLRTSEVAAMRVEDLDWQRGTLYLPTGKNRRGSILPVPAAVQESVSAYLRRGRPISQDSRVFMRHAVPRNKPIESETVRRAIRAGFRRAGLPDRGVHVLRHTAATRMLRAGASLKEIADVLRHGCLDTTTIYTKLDMTRLSKVALPWPEDRS